MLRMELARPHTLLALVRTVATCRTNTLRLSFPLQLVRILHVPQGRAGYLKGIIGTSTLKSAGNDTLNTHTYSHARRFEASIVVEGNVYRWWR